MRLVAFLATLALVSLIPTAAADAQVKVMGGFFDPGTLVVVPGEEVTFVNEDSMAHSVTSTWDDGATFDAMLRQGETFAWTFAEDGEWMIHCRPHAYPSDETGTWEGMIMTVTVKPVQAAGDIGGSLKETPGFAAGLLIVAVLGATMLLRTRRA